MPGEVVVMLVTGLSLGFVSFRFSMPLALFNKKMAALTIKSITFHGHDELRFFVHKNNHGAEK